MVGVYCDNVLFATSRVPGYIIPSELEKKLCIRWSDKSNGLYTVVIRDDHIIYFGVNMSGCESVIGSERSPGDTIIPYNIDKGNTEHYKIHVEIYKQSGIIDDIKHYDISKLDGIEKFDSTFIIVMASDVLSNEYFNDKGFCQFSLTLQDNKKF